MSEARVPVSIPKIAVAPFLSVRNGAAAIEFYKAAFGAEVLFRHDAPDGAVVCELGVGEGRFWLSDESPEHKNFSPETLGGATARMVIELDDPDAMYEQALKAGAKVSCSMKAEYGWRIGRVSDPFGHDWEIGRRN
jgi:PhnB protein